MKGRKTCETLKAIRLEIAKANDIEYTPCQCGHKGTCKGTCPACEQEVEYLEQQLKQHAKSGKTIVLTGVATSLIALSACESRPQDSKVEENDTVVTANAPADLLDSIYHIQPISVLGKSDSIGETPIVAQAKNAKSVCKIKHIKGGSNEDEEEVIDVCGLMPVNHKPEFVGGLKELQKFLNDNLEYPCQALTEGIIGRVLVEFTVMPDGKVENVKLRKSVHPSLDSEALRVVKLTDGMWNNKGHHPNKFLLPIQFRIEDNIPTTCEKKEKKTTFEGGDTALRKFILDNMQYPDYEFDNDIEGTARVSFRVTSKGEVKDAKISNSTGNTNLDNEAIRLVKLTSGKWIQPCLECGKAKETENTISIRFTTWAEYE